MKLELKENMYVRTKDGVIDKILKLNKSYVKGVSQKDELYAYDIDNIVKASYNIIDILEVGDYVNGQVVTQIIPNNRKTDPSTMIYTGTNHVVGLYNEDIEDVITKEQFEQMAYKVWE